MVITCIPTLITLFLLCASMEPSKPKMLQWDSVGMSEVNRQ